MKVVKRIGVVLVSVLLWCVILLAALYAFTILATRDNANVTNIAGFTPMVVQTDSMAPEFYAGDLIFVKKCDPATLKVGDVVTFHTIIDNEYALNTHRIASIDESNSVRSYTTKGDNNEIEDTHMISDGDIVGVYVGHLPKFGKVMDFLSDSVGFMLIIVLPMLLFFIYQVYHLIMVSVNLKKAVALETAEAKIDQQDADSEAARKAKQEAEEMLAQAQRIREEAEAMKADAAKGQIKDEKKAGE
ncbi:MAG: signal peptidase I [Lachnospiraceae bacterium]|nr:signal peptidase I [Lachnospiraceae bacterium]